MTLFTFKLGLLGFWGLWFLIAFSTNLFEGFKALQVFPKTWPFASSNLEQVIHAIERYRVPAWLPRLLFSGVLLWQLLTVSCFGWAIISSVTAGSLNTDLMNAAFLAGSGLWAAFMIADEMLQQYDAEHSHVLFFIAQLASFATLYVLPS